MNIITALEMALVSHLSVMCRHIYRVHTLQGSGDSFPDDDFCVRENLEQSSHQCLIVG